MDTKWKKFSRSIPVRLILNVVLIVSLVVGGFSVANIVNTAAKINHLRNEEIPTIETLYGNKSFQEDISGKMQLLIDYILKVQSLEDTKENKKILEKEKEYLERQYENYKYQLSYTGEDGKEVVISNTKESTKELKNELLYLNYSGYKTEAGYTKTWSNTYRGKETDYTWLNVNEFIRKNGRNNLESRSPRKWAASWLPPAMTSWTGRCTVNTVAANIPMSSPRSSTSGCSRPLALRAGISCAPRTDASPRAWYLSNVSDRVTSP